MTKMAKKTAPSEVAKRTWDVFVSHNSKQKDWARKFVDQLRVFRLNVFFDEDSLIPGEDFVHSLPRAMKASKYVVLLITPDALESEWVAMEVSRARFADPRARLRKVIPVKLEPTDDDDELVAGLITNLNFVDLTDPKRRDAEYRRLLEAIGVS